MKISKMNKDQLEDEINSIEQSMEICCYGTRDIIYLDSLYDEVNKRGYDINYSKSVFLTEEEELK